MCWLHFTLQLPKSRHKPHFSPWTRLATSIQGHLGALGWPCHMVLSALQVQPAWSGAFVSLTSSPFPATISGFQSTQNFFFFFFMHLLPSFGIAETPYPHPFSVDILEMPLLCPHLFLMHPLYLRVALKDHWLHEGPNLDLQTYFVLIPLET